MTQHTAEHEEVDGTANDEKVIPLYCLLPPQIRKKIKALKKLQFQTLQVYSQFYKDLHSLESKYVKLNNEYLLKRADIVSGRVDPSEEECKFEEGYESPDDNSPVVQELRSKLGVTKALEAGAKGIPEFWLTALKNVELTSELIQHHDEPILRHLNDITLSMTDGDLLGFELVFHFASNPYFTNEFLTKEYEMRCSPDEESPWSFDGPEIVKAKGCKINWNQGMDVTEKTVQKKMKSKGKGQTNTVVKTVRNESFFNFFDPPQIPEEVNESFPLDEVQSTLDLDYEVGTFLKEKLIPHAVLFYTGEALDDDTCSEDSSSESETEDGAGDDNDKNCDSSGKSDSGDAGSGDAGSDFGQ